MKGHTIVDTGPIVALLNGRDKFHGWTCDIFDQFSAPLLTCEAVLAEACFLLQEIPGGQDAVFELLTRDVIRLNFQISEHKSSVRSLMAKYSSVPMSLADACLVKMTELHDDCSLITLDSDFTIYRRNGRNVIPIIMPKPI
jgi:predicted nucleic acid-binding protein